MHPTLVAMSPSIAAGGCSRRVRWLAHGGGQESSPRGSWSVRRADHVSPTSLPSFSLDAMQSRWYDEPSSSIGSSRVSNARPQMQHVGSRTVT